MIDYNQIKSWFPEEIRQKRFAGFILREYIQFQILDYLANTRYSKNICFIGGTSLRLIYGIDRFSEDLDFDIKNIDKDAFIEMTDSVVSFLLKSGYTVFADDKAKDKELNAFRRNIVFPEFLYQQKLSPHKEEKFLIKIEMQDQGIKYKPEAMLMKGCGYLFRFNAPPLPVLCSMKISALLNRKKGRDFFDTMFLLQKTDPDYSFLSNSVGIDSKQNLKAALTDLASTVNIQYKARDFEHLLFNNTQNNRIILFKDFVESW